MKFYSSKPFKLCIFSLFLWNTTYGFSAINFINRTKDPFVVRVTASAYDELGRDSALRYLTFFFVGRSSTAKCKGLKAYTLKTKRTKENYDMGYLL